MNPLGFVLPAATVGLGALLLRPQRGFFPDGGKPIIAQATIEERHSDQLTITDHPVEQNAAITDHAFKRPAEVVIRCGWSNSPSKSIGLLGQAVSAAATLKGGLAPIAQAIGPTVSAAQSLLSGNSPDQIKQLYQKLLALQVQRVPFTIYTGKRIYKDMLLETLTVDTDARSENALMVTAACRQVILVPVRLVFMGAAPDQQADPAKTAPVQNVGQQQLQPGNNFTPSASSFAGATAALSSSISGVQQLFSQLPQGLSSLSGLASGVLNNLPTALSEMASSLSSVTSGLGLPSAVPFVDGAQSMTISLGGALTTAQAGVATAVENLPTVLTNSNAVISDVVAQLPSVQAELPAVFADLPSQLASVQSGVSSVLSKIPQVLSQISSPVTNAVSATLNTLTVKWNAPNASWVADVADQNGAAIATGLPVVPGTDLLEQMKHLGIGAGAQMICQVPGNANAVPQYKDLTKNPLYFAGPQSIGTLGGP